MKPGLMNAANLKTGNPSLYCVEDKDDVEVVSEVVKDRQPPPAASTIDTSDFDAKKATQYGALDRLRELVDSGLCDATRADEEDITLLHWAAINNRREIATFLLRRGADVNAVGGELRSTPAHWATRQGHLGMLVQLIQTGANTNLLDAEGSACIHLAAQFGFTAIVAYLVAKGNNVNYQDKNGMTPLAW